MFSRLTAICFIAFSPFFIVSSKFRFGNQASALKFDSVGSYFVLNEPVTNFEGTLHLVDGTPGRIVGESLVFDGGVLNLQSESDLIFTGTYSPVMNNELILQDGTSLDFVKGKVVSHKIMVPAGATVSLSGAPIMTQPIELEDYTSTLRLALKSAFDQNLILNGGKVILDDDFVMTSGTDIIGGGIIDINNKSFTGPGGSYGGTSDITFLNARDYKQKKNMTLTGTRTLKGNRITSDWEGNGFQLVFAGSGRIRVKDNHRLDVVNCNFRGLGVTQSVKQFELSSGAEVRFFKTTLELVDDYTMDKGTFTFFDGCKIITRGYKFNVTANAKVVVDGAALEYENLDGQDENPFTFTDEATQLLYLNGGVIRSTTQRPRLNLFGTNITLFKDYQLSDEVFINFKNDNPSVSKVVVANLSGHTISFPQQGANLFNLDANVNLTLQNGILFGFTKEVVSYGDSNAVLNFGNGMEVRLFEDVVVGSTDRDWNFTGTGLIRGFGNTLILDGSNKLTVTGSSILTLKGLRIVCKNYDSIKCLTPDAKIRLQDCVVVLEAPGWNFAVGSLEIKDNCIFIGGNPNVVRQDTKFSFTTSGNLTILSRSTLVLGHNVEFEYSPDPTLDLGITYNTKRHVKFADSTSTLELAGAVLHSTATGLALDFGRFVISDSSTLISDGANGTEMDIGSAVDFYIKPAVSLNVTGTLAYKASNLV